MIESRFEPTLTGNATYDDLNKAHDEDRQDGSNREEALYPTANVQVDNAGTYRDALTDVNTAEELAEFRTHLTSDPNQEGRNEYQIRTDDNDTLESLNRRMEKKTELFKAQEEATQVYLNVINDTKLFWDLDQLKTRIELALEKGTITEPQLQRIQEAISAKRSEFQEEATQGYLTSANDTKLFWDLDQLKTRIELALEKGIITEPQLQRIQEAINTKRSEFQEVNLQNYIDFIKHASVVSVVEQWRSAADESFKKNTLNATQLIRVQTVASNRIVELREKVN